MKPAALLTLISTLLIGCDQAYTPKTSREINNLNVSQKMPSPDQLLSTCERQLERTRTWNKGKHVPFEGRVFLPEKGLVPAAKLKDNGSLQCALSDYDFEMVGLVILGPDCTRGPEFCKLAFLVTVKDGILYDISIK